MTSRFAILIGSSCLFVLLGEVRLRAALADEESLPVGAVARLGTYRFYHGGTIASLAVSPDGKLVASGGGYDRGRPTANGWKQKHDRRICLWEMATGKKVREITTPDGVVSRLCFSPDGTILAGGCGNVVCLWQVATGKELRVYKEHQENITLLRFSANGKTIYSGEGAAAIHFWDAATGRRWRECLPPKIGKPPGKCKSLGLSPDGKIVVWIMEHVPASKKGADRDRAPSLKTETDLVSFHNTDNKRMLRQFEIDIDYYRKGIESVFFSPDCQLLVVCRREARSGTSLHVYEVASGRKLLSENYALTTDTTSFSPDSNTLAFSDGGYLKNHVLWSRAKRPARSSFLDPRFSPHEIPHDKPCHVFSPDDKTLVVSQDMRVRLWDVNANRPRGVTAEQFWPIQQLVFSTDGRALTTTMNQTEVGSTNGLSSFRLLFCRWDTTSWKESRRFGDQPSAEKDLVLAVSPSTRWLLTRPGDNIVLLCDADTFHPLHAVRARNMPHEGYWRGTLFSPDERSFLLFEDMEKHSRRVRSFDLRTGKERTSWVLGPELGGSSYTLSPDAAFLACPSWWNNTFHLVDLATGKVTLLAKVEPYWKISLFSAYGDYLVGLLSRTNSGGTINPQVVRLWHVKTGREKRPVRIPIQDGQSDKVEALALSPDGRMLATAQDGESVIRLWETASGQEVRQLDGHRDGILSLAFSPDGRTLVSSSSDGTALVWDVRRPSRPGKGDLSAAEMASLWTDLAGDPRRADEAIRTFSRAPGQSVPFLKEHLRPVEEVPPRRLQQLIADLDSDHFDVRTKAARELQDLAELAEPALRKALEGKPSLETRHQIQRIQKHIREAVPAAPQLRALRALPCLEAAGTPQARAVLTTLSRGAPEARLTREARESLQRLERRSARMP